MNITIYLTIGFKISFLFIRVLIITINFFYFLFSSKNMDASVECEPWFTGSREKCELDKNVNHKIFFQKLKNW